MPSDVPSDVPPEADPLIGSTLGDFRITRLLGRGGMGAVYAATQLSLGREVALKLIAPSFAHDPDFRRRFAREAQAMATLDSPHVVHVHTYGEADGRLYLASQLIPGGDLGQMLAQSGPPPIDVACGLIAQVADGLADAHAAGLVHRDIKLANVLVRSTQRGHAAYLADFGIARSADGSEVTHTGTVGTPAYMAPELHLGGQPGVPTDVYALGCLLWATLTGTPPFTGPTPYAVATSHINDPVPQLPATDARTEAVNAVLGRAMAKEPEGRFASAAELREALLAAVRTAPGSPTQPLSPPVGGGAGSGSRTRSRRPLLVGLGLVLVLGAGVVGWSLLDGGPDHRPSPATVDAPGVPTDESTDEPTDESEPEARESDEPDASGDGLASFTDATDGTPEENALANMTAAFAAQLAVEESQARCIAETWLEDAGMDQMIKAGYLDEQGGFHDQDLADVDPSFRTSLTEATTTCLLAG